MPIRCTTHRPPRRKHSDKGEQNAARRGVMPGVLTTPTRTELAPGAKDVKAVDSVINYARPVHAARLRRLTCPHTGSSESVCALTTV